MSKRLALDRDFTRFLNDPTFPYKVTVCIGDERILCSGVLLAQQSSVLEKKFREDDGVLMFEEMLEADMKNSHRVLHDCISYLHGKNLSFTIDDIAVILKFSSFYKVKDLFNEGIEWLTVSLNNSRSAKAALEFLKLSNSLEPNDSVRLKSVISSFIGRNKDIVVKRIGEFLQLGVTGYDMLLIIEQGPSSFGSILKKWCTIADENQKFILDNHSLFVFKDIFPNAEDFSAFVSSISGESQSIETMKALLDIQKRYFTAPDPKAAKSKCENSATSKKSSVSGSIQSATAGPSSSKVTQIKGMNSCVAASSITSQVYRPASSLSSSHFPNHGILGGINRMDWHQSHPADIGPSLCNPETDSLKVLVSNIHPNCSKKDVMFYFQDYGKIDNVDRNFEDGTAVLTYQDSQSVSNLFSLSPSMSCYNQPMYYEVYSESESEYDSTDVYIGNLPPSASKKKLIQLFSFAGWIVNVDIDKDDSSAILQFEDVDAANRLLDCGRRFMLDGYELDVDECADSSSEEEESSSIYIGNIPKETSKDDVKRSFAGYGKINEISIKKGRSNANSHAFVEYETVGSALAVIRASKSKKFEIKGTVLKIDMKRN